MSLGPDTLMPEEAPTDPELPSIEVLLAGLQDPPPLSLAEEWSGFASEALDD
jgi:hypothetical protein